MQSRYPTLVKVSTPAKYVDPALRPTADATAAATATPGGLAIQGTTAVLTAGKVNPEGNVSATRGSLYLRYSDCLDGIVCFQKAYDYLPPAMDALPNPKTGWMVALSSDPRIGMPRHVTIGLDDDTVADNAPGKHSTA